MINPASFEHGSICLFDRGIKGIESRRKRVKGWFSMT